MLQRGKSCKKIDALGQLLRRTSTDSNSQVLHGSMKSYRSTSQLDPQSRLRRSRTSINIGDGSKPPGSFRIAPSAGVSRRQIHASAHRGSQVESITSDLATVLQKWDRDNKKKNIFQKFIRVPAFYLMDAIFSMLMVMGTPWFRSMFSLSAVVMSIFSCAFYTVEFSLMDPFTSEVPLSIHVITTLVSAFFCFEYFVNLALMPNIMRYVTSVMGIVDLISSFPPLIFAIAGWDMSIISTLLQTIRWFKLFKLVTFMPTEVKKQVFTMGLQIFGVIYIFAALLSKNENFTFITGLYLAVTSTVTVGYGDVAVEESTSLVMLITLILLTWILVPMQSQRLSSIVGTTSAHARRKFVKNGDIEHVVVCGNLEVGMTEFFRELFHEDHGKKGGGMMFHVVVMSKGPPTTEMRISLSDPRYSFHVTYLDGDIMEAKDLSRANVSRASTVFVLANKYTENRSQQDFATMLGGLSIMRYIRQHRRPGENHPFLHMELLEPKHQRVFEISTEMTLMTKMERDFSRRGFKSSMDRQSPKGSHVPKGRKTGKSLLIPSGFLSPKGGSKKANAFSNKLKRGSTFKAVLSAVRMRGSTASMLASLKLNPVETHCKFICIDAIKYHLLALTCRCPAVATLVSNLVTSASSQGEPENEWQREYMEGNEFEFYHIPLRSEFKDVSFVDAAAIIYDATGMLLYALELHHPDEEKPRILLNPGCMMIPDTDEHKVKAFVLATDLETTQCLSPQPNEPVGSVTSGTHSSVYAKKLKKKEEGKGQSKKGQSKSEAPNSTKYEPLKSPKASALKSAKSAAIKPSIPATTSLKSSKSVGANTGETADPKSRRASTFKASIQAAAASKSTRSFGAKTDGTAEHSPSIQSKRAAFNSTRRPSLSNLVLSRITLSILEKTETLSKQKILSRLISARLIEAKETNSILKKQRQTLSDLQVREDPIDVATEPAAPVYLTDAHRHAKATSKNYFMGSANVDIADVTVKSGLAETFPDVRGHVIVCGALPNLFNFILPLRARSLTPQLPIVIMYPTVPVGEQWNSIAAFDEIYYVSGMPNDAKQLQNAGLRYASRVVIFTSTQRNHDEANVEDADTIFAFRTIMQENSRIPVVCEIQNRNNIGLLQDSSALANNNQNRPFHMYDVYAAGNVYNSSIVDTLVAQSFYNPFVIDIVELLVSGFDRNQPWVEVFMKEYGAFAEAQLVYMAMPTECVNKPYSTLFHYLAEHEAVPLGIRRGIYPQVRMGPIGNKMPYVYTNPKPTALMYDCDRVFAVASNVALLPELKKNTSWEAKDQNSWADFMELARENMSKMASISSISSTFSMESNESSVHSPANFERMKFKDSFRATKVMSSSGGTGIKRPWQSALQEPTHVSNRETNTGGILRGGGSKNPDNRQNKANSSKGRRRLSAKNIDDISKLTSTMKERRVQLGTMFSGIGNMVDKLESKVD